MREEEGKSLRGKRRRTCESLVGKVWGMEDMTGIVTGLQRTGRRVASDCNEGQCNENEGKSRTTYIE